MIPEPSFVCYVPLTEMAGGVPVVLETKAEDRFRITPEALRAKITPKTKLLILPYPNNPTAQSCAVNIWRRLRRLSGKMI